MAKKQNNTIKVNLYDSSNIPMKHIHGVIGCKTVDGILMNLYSEKAALPSAFVVGRATGKIEAQYGGDEMERVVESRVIMSVQTAKAMRDWLTLQIGDVE